MSEQVQNKSGGLLKNKLITTILPSIICLVAFGAIYLKSKAPAYSLLAIGVALLGLFTILPTAKDGEDEITFFSHSQLFYFWPLWLSSFVFSDITRIFGNPTKLVLKGSVEPITIYLSNTKGLGLTYMIIFACVIFFTSVNLRGVWAVVFGACFAIMGLLFSIFDLWKYILKYMGGVNLFVNEQFYLAIALVLFVPWMIVVFVFDRRRYITFRPTQIKMVHEVGEGQKNFDTVGLTFEKKRDNFFQHLVLGLGSGDLKITTSGGQREEVVFHNVLTVGHVIEEMQKIRERRGR